MILAASCFIVGLFTVDAGNALSADQVAAIKAIRDGLGGCETNVLIEIPDSSFSDKDLAVLIPHLKVAKHMSSLNLAKTKVTGAGLLLLKDLPQVSMLTVSKELASSREADDLQNAHPLLTFMVPSGQEGWSTMVPRKTPTPRTTQPAAKDTEPDVQSAELRALGVVQTVGGIVRFVFKPLPAKKEFGDEDLTKLVEPLRKLPARSCKLNLHESRVTSSSVAKLKGVTSIMELWVPDSVFKNDALMAQLKAGNPPLMIWGPTRTVRFPDFEKKDK